MTSIRNRAVHTLFLFASAACLMMSTLLGAPPARAFGPPSAPTRSIVVEFFNTSTGHYFYTLSGSDIAAIEAGSAGAGWVRTGLSFFAFPSLEASIFEGKLCDLDPDPCKPVSRFYAPGPNSHFFTGSADESAYLRNDAVGWEFESVAFYLPLADAQGRCTAPRVPVHRLYNDRYAFNDSNHRFTASATAREVMLGRGWRDEGVAFCGYALGTGFIAQPAFQQKDPAAIQPLGRCFEEPARFESCIGVSNLPVPSVLFDDRPSSTRDPFNDRTGFLNVNGVPNPPAGLVVAVTDVSRDAAASQTFVQLTSTGESAGIHLHTGTRGPDPYSSVTMLRQLATDAPATGEADRRFMPWRFHYGTPYELRLGFFATIRSWSADPGNHAYGAWTMEFLDTRSRRRVQFNVLSYGTAGPGGDFVGRDVDGTPIVLAAPDVASRFMTTTDGSVVQRLVPAMIAPTTPAGFHSTMNRAQFQALLKEVRALEPHLSADPADYAVAYFGVVNEIYGEGEMGLGAGRIQLGLTPTR